MSSKGIALAAALLSACQQAAPKSEFPAAGRDVAPIVGDSFSTEDARDRVGEAEAVIAFAGVRQGMSVADIGAGEGYYTVRLSRVVGPQGRVLAQDIVPAVRDRLALVGEAMDVAILDHIVMAGTECRSMRQMGLL